MNDILRWAKEADLWMTSEERIAAVERFAALVRADEREAMVAIVKDNSDSDGVCCTDDLLAAIRARSEA